MATIKEPPREWNLDSGLHMVWIILVVALLMYGASRTGTNVKAMPLRTTTQEGEGWISNGGAGAGREIQVAAKNSQATWTECRDVMRGGRQQDTRWYPPERVYTHNGIETPREAFNKQCKLDRMRLAASLKRISDGFRDRADVVAGKGRLNPDERVGPMSQHHETEPLKSQKEMNEFSCYLCQLPIKTAKQLMNHVNGKKHRGVFESMKRDERGYDYNRDNPGLRRKANPELGTTLRRSTRRKQHARERFDRHQNDYIGSGDNRVNSHIGPAPDCNSDGCEPDIPDNPIEDNPPNMYVSFQLPVGLDTIRKPNIATDQTGVGANDGPRVNNITPDPRMLTPVPTTEELVRRYGDVWTGVTEEKWDLKDG
jgi:hypothetical protein